MYETTTTRTVEEVFELFQHNATAASGDNDTHINSTYTYPLDNTTTSSNISVSTNGIGISVTTTPYILPVTICPSGYQEPHPSWLDSLPEWGCVFPLHYYSFSIGFLLSVIVLLISTITVHETGRKNMVMLNAFLLVAGLCRGLPLLIDPYGSMKVLPDVCNSLLSTVVKPCLTSGFCVILWTFLNISQVKIGLCGVPRDRLAMWLILAHFSITISVHLLVMVAPQIRLLLVLSEATFIIWGLCLCAIFVMKTFRITQFTSETKRAYKELSDYNLNKNVAGTTKRLKRVKRPKMRMERSDSYSALEDTSDNSDSSDEEKAANRIEPPKKSVERREPSLELVMQNDTLTVFRNQYEKRNGNGVCHLDIEFTDRDTDSESGSVFTADDFPHTCDRPVNCHVDNDHDCHSDHETIPNNKPATAIAVTTLPRDSIFELGYLGDNEYGSPYKRRLRLQHSSTSDPSKRERSLSETQQQDVKMLPRDTNMYISYRRLRQGRCLHKLVKLSHVTVMALFLLCILHLYSMFGVYGILSRQTKVQPWPWLAFQTCLRTAELLIVVTMTYTAIRLTSNRHRNKDWRRKKKAKPETSNHDRTTSNANENVV